MKNYFPENEIEIIADLTERMRYLCIGIDSSLDESQNYRPFFYYSLRTQPAKAYHSSWDISDMVFRAIDALSCYRNISKSDEFDRTIETVSYTHLTLPTKA